MTRDIQQMVDALTQKYGTSSPFALCEELGIKLCEQELPAHMNGFCVEFDSGFVIVLNEHLSLQEKAYTCGHELGHILLHPGTNALATAHYTNLCVGKYEREADYFSACLIIDPNLEEWHSTYECLTLEQIALLAGLPIHVVQLRFQQYS